MSDMLSISFKQMLWKYRTEKSDFGIVARRLLEHDLRDFRSRDKMNEYLVKNGFSEFFIDIANKLFDEFDSLPNAEIAITGNGRGIKMRNRENIKRKYHD